MKKAYTCLMLWRSIPVMIVYRIVSDNTRKKINQDMKMLGYEPNIYSVHKLMLFHPIFRRQFYVRVLTESLTLYRLIRWTYRPLESLEISATTGEIGGGLQIYHGYSTIIFCHSMGENCRVYQNVTIGRGKEINRIDVPIIGNNVTIYSGAIVIGGIHIGDHAKIGAGAVVVNDVPPNATIVGQPMRVIEH